jgi:hypothetical protein
MDEPHDAAEAILRSWDANARVWTDAMREARIERPARGHRCRHP